MVISTAQILALSAPILFLLCSSGFALAWRHFRSGFYPLIFSLAFLCFTVAATVRILTWSSPPGWVNVLASGIYLGAVLLLAYGVLVRIRVHFDLRLPIGVVLAAIMAQIYFCYVRPDELASAMVVNGGMGAILLMAVPYMGVLRHSKVSDRIVYWVYLLFTLHFFLALYFAATLGIVDAIEADSPSVEWVVVRLGRVLLVIFMGMTLLGSVMLDIIEKLKRERNIDGLTQLHNRRGFEEQGALQIASGRNRPVSLLLCDIDYFKQVNDKYGHAAGDSVLAGFAQILRHCARTTDIVGRFGGEEFIILLPDTSPERAVYVAQRIRTLLAATHFPELSEDYVLTASFGVAGLRENESLRDLFARADALLYGAKADGRDRVILEDQASVSDTIRSEIAA